MCIRDRRDGSTKFPFSITLFQGGVYRNKSSLEGYLVDVVSNENKFAATTQLLIARKFSKNLSLQLAPSFIYRGEENELEGVPSSRFALGIGGRYFP